MSHFFFALWPDPAVRDKLYRFAQNMQRDCGGRVMRRENLHQTLVFVGDVADDKIAGLESAAGQVRGSPLKLLLGVTDYWRHNRIVWAAPDTIPAPLTSLVSVLEQELAHAGFEFDRRPHVAHITLVRDARAPTVLPVLRCEWAVRDFVLAESGRGERGVEYRVVARWPLAG